MVLIVDANILISASLNPYSKIAGIIYTTVPKIEFILPEFAITEIKLHAGRICRDAGIELIDFYSNLSFLSEKLFVFSDDSIDTAYFRKAKIITGGIDVKDAVYVGFALALDAMLWTGDAKLSRGLKRKGFRNIVNTSELVEIIKGL